VVRLGDADADATFIPDEAVRLYGTLDIVGIHRVRDHADRLWDVALAEDWNPASIYLKLLFLNNLKSQKTILYLFLYLIFPQFQLRRSVPILSLDAVGIFLLSFVHTIFPPNAESKLSFS
jgi:hypothetical protein